MVTTDQIKELDLELKRSRQDLKKDAAQLERKIDDKVEQARDKFSPSRIFARHPLIVIAAGTLAVAALIYWRHSVAKAAKPARDAVIPAAKSGVDAATKELPAAAGTRAGKRLAQAAVA